MLNGTLAVPSAAHFFIDSVSYSEVIGPVFDIDLRLLIPYSTEGRTSSFTHRSFSSLTYRGIDGSCYLSSSKNIICGIDECWDITNLEACIYLSTRQSYYCPRHILLRNAPSYAHTKVHCEHQDLEPVDILHRHIYFPQSTDIQVYSCGSKSILSQHSILAGAVVEFDCGTYVQTTVHTFSFCTCVAIHH